MLTEQVNLFMERSKNICFETRHPVKQVVLIKSPKFIYVQHSFYFLSIYSASGYYAIQFFSLPLSYHSFQL
jgi:hypothetical protein